MHLPPSSISLEIDEVLLAIAYDWSESAQWAPELDDKARLDDVVSLLGQRVDVHLAENNERAATFVGVMLSCIMNIQWALDFETHDQESGGMLGRDNAVRQSLTHSFSLLSRIRVMAGRM